ncbi:MAG: DnaJ family molecular chaperone [Nitrospiria bacterium]
MNVIPEKTGPERGRSFLDQQPQNRPCWSCEYKSDDLYNCSQCDKLQEFLEETDYFNWFGFGYFLSIDQDALEKQYHLLSRKFHPDFHQKTSPEEQAISLENTAHLTKAYRILKDRKKRMAYLIELLVGAQAPPTNVADDLFEEILEIQERMEAMQEMDRSQNDRKEALLSSLKIDLENMESHRKEIEESLQSLSLKWDCLEEKRGAGPLGDSQILYLQEIKTLLAKDTYLDRIIQEIRRSIEGGS